MTHLRLSDMAPAFRRFLQENQGFTGGKLSPLNAVSAMCTFFVEQPLESTAKRDDTLLFQLSPLRPWSPALVNITRQAYRGAGRSVQLSLDVVFNNVDPSGGKAFDLWSTDCGSAEVFCSIALGELARRGVLLEPGPTQLRVDRF